MRDIQQSVGDLVTVQPIKNKVLPQIAIDQYWVKTCLIMLHCNRRRDHRQERS